MATFEETGIWTRALGQAAGMKNELQLERLRSSYRTFWSHATLLSREIQRDVPNLTLHDEAHFDALWHRADQIAGPDLYLTPLEVFVLGGAILLHDNANSLAAFEGGLAALQKTAEWQDAAAESVEVGNDIDAPDSLSAEANAAVLFEVLRSLHAERAITLAHLCVTNGSRRHYLIEDEQLRTHLGDVMGQVAASHHWDIATLPSHLPSICGALAGMPPTWTVRPVLVACLLRCADAVQLDQHRTPDFLYALLHLRGVSELHWRAQNRLATPVVSSQDPTALIFSSTMPFGPDDSDAWWIAHDAIQVANRELQAANALLRDLRLPHIAVTRVEGALSPSALSQFVLVRGWRPVQAEVRITQIGKVVEMFGGEQLYGRDPSVTLRELIQNAADAIRFRREIEPLGSDYEGRITIRIVGCESKPDTCWLEIDDDGLGMSEAVLTGPLIDFGSSYIASALVKSERPGLLSKGKKRIGRFGIGFFSCFMISDEVIVTSRPFDAGYEELRTLHFRDGLGHRPLLLESQSNNLSFLTSTRIRLRLTSEQHEKLLQLPNRANAQPAPISLIGLVGMLCPMLDVNVFVMENGVSTQVHHRRWMDEDRLTWLRRVTGASNRSQEKLESDLIEAVPLLSFVDVNDPSAGLACITGRPAAGAPTVGTLRASLLFNSFADEFTGVIDYEPADPRRARGKPKAGEKLKAWATEQAIRHAERGTTLPGRIFVAQRISDFGGDATPILGMYINREWSDLETILEHLIKEGPLYAPVKYRDYEGHQLGITVVRERHTGFVDSYRPSELQYLVRTLEPGADNDSLLYSLPAKDNSADTGFYFLLCKLATVKGYEVSGEIAERIEFARYVGAASPRDGLEHGKVIGCGGLKVSARKLT